MGAEESYYLDDNVDRVRSLCRTYLVPFSERKSGKCGKRCKIISTKRDYMKVRFQDNSEFWFPCQAIKLKSAAISREGSGDEDARNDLHFNSRYQRNETSKGQVKSHTTSQKQSPTSSYWTYQYQQQVPDENRRKCQIRSSSMPLETSYRGYHEYDVQEVISKNAVIDERAVVEVPNDDKNKYSLKEKYSCLPKKDASTKRKSTAETASKSSFSSLLSTSSYLPSTIHKPIRRFLDTKFDLRQGDDWEYGSTQLGLEPTGISSPVSSKRSSTGNWKLSTQYDQEEQSIKDSDYQSSDDLWLEKDGRSSLSPDLYTHSRRSLELYRNSGSLRPRNAFYREKFNYLVGFANLGNTCYMNAALQCLLNNTVIMEAVELHFQSRCRHRTNSLTKEFLSLAKNYMLNGERSGRSISPEYVKEEFVAVYPEFEGYCQHDASEFLSYLLAEIGETPTCHKTYRTIDSLFRLHCRIERRHNKKSAVLTSTDSQLLMSLPVVILHRKRRRRVTVDLTDLEASIAYESDWTRHNCEITIEEQRYSSFEQRSTIIASSTPPFLIVHLKRFRVSKGYLNSIKIKKVNLHINVPQRLDLSQFTDNPMIKNKYVLVGAICHLGKRSSSGHYYSLIKPYSENAWFLADDQRVSEQSSMRSEIKNFYVCFYRKVS